MKQKIDFPHAPPNSKPRTLRMNLKDQLLFYCKKKGVKPAELARSSGVSKQVISLWLGGAKPKNVEQVKKVADALGVTVDHLLFGEGEDRNAAKVTELDALLGEGWVSGFFEVRLRRVRR